LSGWTACCSSAFQISSFSRFRHPTHGTSHQTVLSACNRSDEDEHPPTSASSSSSSSSPFLFSQDLSRREAWQHTASTAAAAMTTTASGLLLPPSAHAKTSPSPSITTVAAATNTSPVPTIRLGKSSLEVSRTIQGHWQLSGGHGKIRESDALKNMDAHFNAGITTLDTADIYGPSEIIVGKYRAQNPKAIPITKFCCFRFLNEITRDEVRQRVEQACERLNVARLPLLQFFWLRYDVGKFVDVALWLTELKEEGLIQEIGATNFDLPRLKQLKAAGVPIVSHQVQLSALDRRPVQSGMAEWCAENDISLIAFGTIGSGILSDRYLGKPAPTQEQKNTASMRMYSNTAARFGSWNLVQELLQTMEAIAVDVRKDGRCPQCTIANVAQRYVLQTPAVAALIIGVRNQEHIAENSRTHSFALRQDEKAAIDAVVAKRKGPEGVTSDIERGIV